MTKELFYVAWHKEERDEKGKLITPACVFKFYIENGKDCFNDSYIASCEQFYARPNKKIDYKWLKLDDFKGKKGIQEFFYNEDQIEEYLYLLINEGYDTRRITRQHENSLADSIFQYVYNLMIRKASFVLPR